MNNKIFWLLYYWSTLFNDKRIGSFGVSKIDLGLVLIGVCVSLHGDTSNFDNISASPVLASIIANRKPTFKDVVVKMHRLQIFSWLYNKLKCSILVITYTYPRSITKREESAVWSWTYIFFSKSFRIKYFWIWIILGIVM